MINSIINLLFIVCFLSFASKIVFAVKEPGWFQSKQSECNAAVPGPLDVQLNELTPAQKASSNTTVYSWGTNWVEQLASAIGASGTLFANTEHLNKTAAPGDGKCCIFDATGNMIAAARTTKGIDECKHILTSTEAGYVLGMYWCVGRQNDCHIDWWLRGR